MGKTWETKIYLGRTVKAGVFFVLRFRKYLGYVCDPKRLHNIYTAGILRVTGGLGKMGGIRETSLIFISCSCMTDVLGMNGRENV